MNYIYNAKLEDNGAGGLLVTFPDVPEAITEGASRDEALANASEALGFALRHYLGTGHDLPPASGRGVELVPIEVTAADALKLAVVESFRASGLRQTELAERLGVVESEARRILNPDHPTKIRTLELALRALGKRASVAVVAA
ncbi:type II toxin-antitoxin system HicB family antitoxin [Jiella avicenniae]|uniref:Type II toxin-antitoxin system HicB family antitoxin n=1 Tax=Jiella avicenniae TaxID=2907202 RepID=A0A9X1P3A2_9HYPH|nr:type II toxin-antitoxin system HicB family antitoxin [Jiella avicenniae]MCE7029525.1 type II toxin-antitoxin system HicB family antitoxin [Jiella avicenniae]